MPAPPVEHRVVRCDGHAAREGLDRFAELARARLRDAELNESLDVLRIRLRALPARERPVRCRPAIDTRRRPATDTAPTAPNVGPPVVAAKCDCAKFTSRADSSNMSCTLRWCRARTCRCSRSNLTWVARWTLQSLGETRRRESRSLAHQTTNTPISAAPRPPPIAAPTVASAPAYASAAVDATYVTTTAHAIVSHNAARCRTISVAAAARPKTPYRNTPSVTERWNGVCAYGQLAHAVIETRSRPC